MFFEYKHEGKKYKFKKRERVNRFKTLYERKGEIKILRDTLDKNLYFGWNPVLDPKRKGTYNPFLIPKPEPSILTVSHHPEKIVYKH